MKKLFYFFFISSLSFIAFNAYCQTKECKKQLKIFVEKEIPIYSDAPLIKGKIVDFNTEIPYAEVKIKFDTSIKVTDTNGVFTAVIWPRRFRQRKAKAKFYMWNGNKFEFIDIIKGYKRGIEYDLKFLIKCKN